ncbi:MAG: DUF1295 domain-containing protein [Parahaliea sp.]
MNFFEFLELLAINAGVALAVVILLWLASIRLRDVSIIDMFFALIFSLLTITSYLVGGGEPQRKILLLVLVLAWALRMTLYLVHRNWGHGEDPRYTRLRQWVGSERAFRWLSLRQVFLLQGVVIWLASLPVQLAMCSALPQQPGPLAAAGTLLWFTGLVCETVADHQLARFRRNTDNRGKVLETGLWRYSRHPNYFGELCVWWGIFLIASECPLGWLTIIGPLIYSHLVINVTGQRTLDKKLAREKPDYARYIAQTSGLIPLPPRRPH